MKEIVILGEKIQVNDDWIILCTLKNMYAKAAEKYNSIYKKLVLENIETNADFLEKGKDYRVNSIRMVVVDMASLEIEAGFYDVSEKDLYEYVLPIAMDTGFWDLTDKELENITDRIDEILNMQENAELRRKLKQMNAGTWVGGGFGIGGAIKGAATATAFNAASKAASSVSNGIKNAISGLYANKQIKNILNEKFDSSELIATYRSFTGSLYMAERELLENRMGRKIDECPTERINRCHNILNNLLERKPSDDLCKKYVIEAAKLYPLTERLYQYMIIKFGDTDKQIENICKELGVMSIYEPRKDENFSWRGEFNFKEGLLYEIFENCEYETMENLEAVAKMIEKSSKIFGVDIPQNLIRLLAEEKEYIEENERTYKDIIYPTLEDMKTAQKEDETIAELISHIDTNDLEALKNAKAKINAMKLEQYDPQEYIEQLDAKICDVEKQLRTIDGIEYSTIEEAKNVSDEKAELDSYISNCNSADDFINGMKYIRNLACIKEIKEYGIDKLNERALSIFSEQIKLYKNNKDAVEAANLKNVGCSIIVWIVISLVAGSFFPIAGVIAWIILAIYIVCTIKERNTYKKHKQEIDIVNRLKENGFNI